MRRLLFTLSISVCFLASSQSKRLNEYVNPFIGTGGHGHTYPGVSMPFGMMQLSPDSRLEGWDGCGGYHYSDSVIYGFSHTHLSGTGVSDYGDLLIMPFVGEDQWQNGYQETDTSSYGSKFSHDTEKAHAGYYSVQLEDHDIKAELTTSLRCGYHKYTFPKDTVKKLIIDLDHRDKLLDTDLIFLNDSTIIGKRISAAWATEQHFYFSIVFSSKPTSRKFWKNPDNNYRISKAILEFDTDNPVLEVKVGMSAVDINGAKNNLKKEMPQWLFEYYQKLNEDEWNKELGKIRIHSKDENFMHTFYTALYHSYLNPNLFSDYDGRYRGMDMKIHTNRKHKQYTIFSLWDTFRATHPLFTITQQKRTNQFIQTFLNQYRQGGILPIWELSANYTGCMIGYHSIPVIVDAYVKGIRDFDENQALRAMIHSAEQTHLGLEAYMKRGYISSEDESESVSKTLEYAYDDWCIAVMADSIGKKDIAERFYRRSQFYKNIYNPENKFMAPRHNGGWKNNFKPDEVTFDYTEANSWQYSLFAPHDVEGLIDLLGGEDQLEIWLDNLFSASSETSGRHQVDITGLIGQYAHGNEPSHHMAYLYNFTKHPYKTQKYVHKILTQLYANEPDGLCGNEDCGQMSSWYVLSSMGIYSMTPGSDIYMLGTPLFDSTFVELENGNTFTVRATNLMRQNSYVKRVLLNGVELSRNFIHHHEIMSGAELVFEMTNEPNEDPLRPPRSKVIQGNFLRSPIVVDASPTFAKKKKVALIYEPNTEVYYTLDGTEPTRESLRYKKPVKIKKSTEFKAAAFLSNNYSYATHSSFKKSNNKWDIQHNSTYQNQYSGGGDKALIDQIYGSTDFRVGSWQGFYGQDLDVVIDIKKSKTIASIYLNCLQDARSWIWYPEEVKFMGSKNGKDWFEVGIAKNEVPLDQYGSMTQKLGLEKEFAARYIRIVAKNFGKCPEWHPGAGNDTHIFADEVLIQMK